MDSGTELIKTKTWSQPGSARAVALANRPASVTSRLAYSHRSAHAIFFANSNTQSHPPSLEGDR